jgi:hypothetical protein
MNPLLLLPEPKPGVEPYFKFTEGLPYKLVGSTIFGLLGMYYLALGKREGDAKRMVLGGLLILLSSVVF